MLETFHAENPGLRLSCTPDPENLNEQCMADFEAGTAPDVVFGGFDLLPIWKQRAASRN
ncbi:MAG: hypothetical protein MUO23_07140 [Anaerolineales bacterium]|nr:hypothetical protein [Anaerolineales bacterium]